MFWANLGFLRALGWNVDLAYKGTLRTFGSSRSLSLQILRLDSASHLAIVLQALCLPPTGEAASGIFLSACIRVTRHLCSIKKVICRLMYMP